MPICILLYDEEYSRNKNIFFLIFLQCSNNNISFVFPSIKKPGERNFTRLFLNPLLNGLQMTFFTATPSFPNSNEPCLHCCTYQSRSPLWPCLFWIHRSGSAYHMHRVK